MKYNNGSMKHEWKFEEQRDQSEKTNTDLNFSLFV